MPNLQGIRRRIVSVKSTQKITRAMKMVAAAKLRRGQEALHNARPYAYHLRDIANSLITHATAIEHPLLRRAPGGRVGLLVVTSDRGLCGGYNSSLILQTMRLLHTDFAGRDVEITIVGRKGNDGLRRRCPKNIKTAHVGLLERYSVNSDTAVIDPLADDFLAGRLNEVYVLYNEFKSAITQRIALERLLPYEPEPKVKSMFDDAYFIFEPDEDLIITALLRDNLRAQLHRIFHEAMASEHGARMAAMDAATRNAGDVIARLTLNYNRVRQGAITKEVVEIVSGAEAL